jgi:hypothetical protein
VINCAKFQKIGRLVGDMGALAKSSTFVFEGFRLDRYGLFRRDQNGVFVPIPIGARLTFSGCWSEEQEASYCGMR